MLLFLLRQRKCIKSEYKRPIAKNIYYSTFLCPRRSSLKMCTECRGSSCVVAFITCAVSPSQKIRIFNLKRRLDHFLCCVRSRVMPKQRETTICVYHHHHRPLTLSHAVRTRHRYIAARNIALKSILRLLFVVGCDRSLDPEGERYRG